MALNALEGRPAHQHRLMSGIDELVSTYDIVIARFK
jgi:hypothetical protein